MAAESPIAVRPRAVLCAGMRRGGSTLQSQLVSAILGGARVQATNPEAVRLVLTQDPAHESPPQVLKCHEFVPGIEDEVASGRVRVVYVYRDVRDVVASICRKYRQPAFSFVAGGAQAILLENRQWMAVPGIHVARYESMVADLPAEIARLARFLGVPTDESTAARVADDFSMERQKDRIERAFQSPGSIVGQGANAYDRESLLHRDHIQSGEPGSYRNVLRRHEAAALEWVCGDWLREHGYRIDFGRLAQAAAVSWYRIRDRAHAWRKGGKDPRT